MRAQVPHSKAKRNWSAVVFVLEKSWTLVNLSVTNIVIAWQSFTRTNACLFEQLRGVPVVVEIKENAKSVFARVLRLDCCAYVAIGYMAFAQYAEAITPQGDDVALRR